MMDPVRPSAVKLAAAKGNAADGPRATDRSAGSAKAAPVPLPQLLDLVAELAAAGPPVDHARIAQVRHAIADGRYPIDADAVAKAILNFAVKA